MLGYALGAVECSSLRDLLERHPCKRGEDCYEIVLEGTCARVDRSIELLTLLHLLIRAAEASGASRSSINIMLVQYPPDTRELELHRLLVSDGRLVPEEATPILVQRDE